MQRPNVERHVLQEAFGEHVVGVVVRIDEPGNDELAARFDHSRLVRNRGAAHDFFLQLQSWSGAVTEAIREPWMRTSRTAGSSMSPS